MAGGGRSRDAGRAGAVPAAGRAAALPGPRTPQSRRGIARWRRPSPLPASAAPPPPPPPPRRRRPPRGTRASRAGPRRTRRSEAPRGGRGKRDTPRPARPAPRCPSPLNLRSVGGSSTRICSCFARAPAAAISLARYGGRRRGGGWEKEGEEEEKEEEGKKEGRDREPGRRWRLSLCLAAGASRCAAPAPLASHLAPAAQRPPATPPLRGHEGGGDSGGGGSRRVCCAHALARSPPYCRLTALTAAPRQSRAGRSGSSALRGEAVGAVRVRRGRNYSSQHAARRADGKAAGGRPRCMLGVVVFLGAWGH